VDVSVGPYHELNENRLRYVVRQLEEAIKWMEEITGREYDDERLIKAVYNFCKSTSLWAEICCLNKAVPAPLEEKTMYSLYVLNTLMPSKEETVRFYEKLRNEIRDRVKKGEGALETEEKLRVMTDTQPPWAFLEIWRYLNERGVVSIGSLYTFGLMGTFEVKEDGTWGPATPPDEKGIEVTTREEALRVLAEWALRKPEWQHFYDSKLRSDLIIRIAREWKVDGVLLHYNRGCEGLSIGIAETALALKRAGVPVMGFEGNMGDEREFDLEGTKAKIDAFIEMLMRRRRKGRE
jgi:benzoyl-CoA reductase subunit B